MRSWSSLICRAVLCGGLAALVLSPAAKAQAPSYPPPPPAGPPPASSEAADIASCLCLHREIDALGANMNAKRQTYNQSMSELNQLDARLSHERATIDVNNPEAIARFRQLLQRRDALFRRSTGPVASDLSHAVAHYNDKVNEYNGRCANRPRNPDLLARVQATLSCPAPY